MLLLSICLILVNLEMLIEQYEKHCMCTPHPTLWVISEAELQMQARYYIINLSRSRAQSKRLKRQTCVALHRTDQISLQIICNKLFATFSTHGDTS